MCSQVFLFGGGGSPGSIKETYSRFVEVASTPEGCRIAIVIVEVAGNDDDFQALDRVRS
jgi:hypothetical protein